MSRSSLHAEDTCLNNQASSSATPGTDSTDSTNGSPGQAPAAVGAPDVHRSHSTATTVHDPEKTDDVTGDPSVTPSSSAHKTRATAGATAQDSDDSEDPETSENSENSEKPARLNLVRTVTGASLVPPDPGHINPHQQQHMLSVASHTTHGQDSSSADSSTDDDDVTFPEGGLEGWLVVLGSFCAMFSVFGLINTAAVFESWFSTHQLSTYTASETGWIFSVYLFIVFFVGIQVGPIFDRYGQRWLVIVGSVLMVASNLLLGLCTQYYQIMLCYSVLGGLGGALLNTPAYGCVAHFFNVRRGLATGIATTAGGIGGIVFPILMQHLLPKLGFAWSTRILGFILLALSVPTNLCLRTRLPLAGNLQKNAAAVDTEQEALSTHGSSVHRKRGSSFASVWPDFSIFRDKRYAIAAIGIFFMEWGIFVPVTFIVSYATEHGQTTDSSYILLSALNAGSVLGRFLPSFLADKMGRFNVIILTIALSSATVLAIWLPAGSSYAVMMTFCVVFGFASGSNLGLVAVCLGQLCDPSEYGRYYATAMMVASFGTLSSVPIGGAMLGGGLGNYGWMGLMIFSGVSYAVAMVCYTAARVMAVGWKLTAVF